MNKLHLLAHNNRNFVKEGDFVVQYKTKIGTIGKANGSYWAHLHHSISRNLSVVKLRKYINGWTKEEVEARFEDPSKCTDYTKMFGRVMDIGNRGYSWLQIITSGLSKGSPHPGQDINGTGGGDTDLGYEYTSPCNGRVIYVNNTSQKDGWGKMVVIEEINNLDETMEKEFMKQVSKICGEDFGTNLNKKEQQEAAEKLREYRKNHEKLVEDFVKKPAEVEVEKIVYKDRIETLKKLDDANKDITSLKLELEKKNALFKALGELKSKLVYIWKNITTKK